MKKYFFFSIVFLLCISAHSQVHLWGMTSSGGRDNAGVIFNVESSGNNYKLEHEFQSLDFANPYSNVPIQASDGMIYGLTNNGGTNDEGVLFQYNPSNRQYSVKFSFKNITGSYPIFLLQAKDGMLYGLTYKGGKYNQGVLFQYNLNTNTYVKKFDFKQLDGVNLVGALTEATDGMLYGMARDGGNYSAGVLFQYNLATSVYKKKIDLQFGTPALLPSSKLVQSTDGMLYGVLTEGGGSGTLFQYDPVTAVDTKKIYFDTLSGNFPCPMIQAKDGMLYGLMSKGGIHNKGILFQYNPVTSKFTKKIDFDGTNGDFPAGTLTEGNDGMLYGLTAYGGTEEFGGVLFQYNLSTSVLTEKIDLGRKNTHASGGMLLASDGMFYGMTTIYPKKGGTFFQYNASTGVYTTILDTERESMNGKVPFGSLMQASDGMLYGLSFKGGISDSGTLFQFNPINHSYVKKFDFNLQTGSSPYSSLIQANDGSLYGMTTSGGAGNSTGVLFQYNPVTANYTKKIDFRMTGETGCNPFGAVMQAKDGSLYGLTSNFGKGGAGTLFQYNLSSSALSIKYDFQLDGITGNYPFGSLMQASNGMLYGLTSTSQTNGIWAGSLFQYDPVTATYTFKFNFNDTTCIVIPTGALVEVKDGMLYGMAQEIGSKKMGYLFQYDLINSVFTKKFKFDSINGSNPMGSLMKASNGMLYGMTNKGGTHDLGVLFQYDPVTSTLIKKMDFNGVNGAHPTGDLIEINATVGIAGNSFSDAVVVFPNPTTGSLHLKIPFACIDKIRSMELLNVLGEKMTDFYFTVKLTDTLNGALYSFDMTKLPHGIYFLTIKTDTEIATKKIIKK